MAHTCIAVKESFARLVSQVSSFEMSFSRTILDDTSVSVLRPSPCVEGWIIHPLSSTESISDIMNTGGSSALTEPGWIDVWDVPIL